MGAITLMLIAGAMFIFMYVAEICRDASGFGYWMSFIGVATCSACLLWPNFTRHVT